MSSQNSVLSDLQTSRIAHTAGTQETPGISHALVLEEGNPQPFPPNSIAELSGHFT